MKRYTLLLALVLIGSTTTWASGYNSYIPPSFACPSPCWTPNPCQIPNPCYQPPMSCPVPQIPCMPQIPCPRPVSIAYANASSCDSVLLWGNGSAFAGGCGGVMISQYQCSGGPNFGGYPFPQ
ncbi:MAG: hypothetical protein JW993_01865 [Sedimentisphaerales bacterium]|nr:hypothetical protein [Sedimentisphaerales bacterium]